VYGGAAWLPVVARIAMPFGQSTVILSTSYRNHTNTIEPEALGEEGHRRLLADAALDERKPHTRAAEVPRCTLLRVRPRVAAKAVPSLRSDPPKRVPNLIAEGGL